MSTEIEGGGLTAQDIDALMSAPIAPPAALLLEMREVRKSQGIAKVLGPLPSWDDLAGRRISYSMGCLPERDESLTPAAIDTLMSAPVMSNEDTAEININHLNVVDKINALADAYAEQDAWVDPDDAPEFTAEIAARAQLSVGGKVIREATGTLTRTAEQVNEDRWQDVVPLQDSREFDHPEEIAKFPLTLAGAAEALQPSADEVIKATLKEMFEAAGLDELPFAAAGAPIAYNREASVLGKVHSGGFSGPNGTEVPKIVKTDYVLPKSLVAATQAAHEAGVFDPTRFEVTGTITTHFNTSDLYDPRWKQELKWATHNLFAHPISELAYWIGKLIPAVGRFGEWLHDATVPFHAPNTGRG